MFVKTTRFLFVFILLFLLTMIFSASKTSAQSADGAERAAASCVNSGGEWDGSTGSCIREDSNGSACQPRQSILGIPTWYKYLDSETDASGRCSPILSGSDTEERVNSALPIGVAVLEAVLRFAGLVAVVMVFWGGLKYITSQGSPDNAKAARSTVINAMIGLVIVIVSTTVVTMIGRTF